MDCFKIQAETLQYLRKQQQTFNTIIKTLDIITQLNQPLLSLFPQNFQVSETSMKTQKQFKAGTSKKCTKFDLGVSQKYGNESRYSEDNKYKQAESEIQITLYHKFQQALSFKPKTKQQKYLAFLDVAYYYFKIANTKINKKIDLNPQKTQKQEQIKRILKPEIYKQNEQKEDENYEQLFGNYLKMYSKNIGSQNNIPILIKFCYRIQQINRSIWETRDLIKIRDFCVLLKQNIYEDMKKQLNRQQQREQFLQQQRKKLAELQLLQTKKQNKIKNNINQTNASKSKNKLSYQTSRPESPGVIPLRNQSKSRTMRTTISFLSGLNQKKKLDSQWLNKYEKIPIVQNYYRIFIWRLDSCIILINQILHKDAYNRENFVQYLKMGQWIRQQYMNNSKSNNSNLKNNMSTNKLPRKNYTNDINSQILKLNLKQLLITYSSIVKHAHKLKQCKYFDMLTLQLHINFKKMQKLLRKQSKTSQINLQSDSQLLNNIITNHLITKNTRRYNRYGRNAQVITQKNSHKNILNQHKNNNQNNQQKHISFKDIIDDNSSSQEQKQDKINQNSNFISIDYQFINRQLNQAVKNQQLKTYQDYFRQNDQTLKEQQIKNMQKQSERKQLFTRTISYIMHKQSNSLAKENQMYSGKYHIKLKRQYELTKTAKEQKQKKLAVTTHQLIGRSNNNNNQQTQFNSRRNKTVQMTTFRTNTDGTKLPIFNRSGRKQKTTYISMTKRNTKSGLLLSEVKESSNLYRTILSTEKRAMVITNKMLEDEILCIHNIDREKPTPTFQEIFIITSKPNARIQKQQSYSFRGIGMGTANNSSIGTLNTNQSWNDNNFMTEMKITMINCFGHQIGFLTLHIFKNAGNDEISIQFYSELRKLYFDKITIINKPNLQIENSKQIEKDKQVEKQKPKQRNKQKIRQVQKQNKKSKQKQIFIELRIKDVFSFDELKRQINTSQFYFQLIQQAIQKNIDSADMDIIEKYLEKEQEEQKQLGLSTQTKQNQSSNPSDKQNSSVVAIRKSNQKHNKPSMKKQSFLFLCMNRMSKSLVYWYYTKGSKINGNVLLKREIPEITDSLKFAIALDFMKKYNHKQCLQKLSHVRNKKALFQCFKYLFYGRKNLVKGLILRKNNYMFYVLSLEHFSQKNFQIKTKQQGKSQFKDLQFTLTIYNCQNMSWNIIQGFKYPVQKVLNPEKMTLFMLSNLIQGQISSQYLEALAMDIYFKQSDARQFNDNTFQLRHYNIIQPNSSSDKNKITGVAQSNHLFKTNSIISHYIHLILWFIDIVGIPINLDVIFNYKRVFKIQNSFLRLEQYHLGCGLVLQIIKHIQNKGKIHQVSIFQSKDFKSKNTIQTKQIFQNNKSFKQNSQKQSICKEKQKQIKLFSQEVIQKDNNQQKYKRRLSKFSACSNISQISSYKLNSNSNYAISSINDSPSTKHFPTKNLSCIQQESINKIQNIQQYINFKISKSAYHNRMVLACHQNNNRKLVNKIKKSIIQKQQMDNTEIIHKKIIKTNNIYVYVCLSFNKMISSYRLDIYETVGSKKYASYFKLSEFGITLKKQDNSKDNNAEFQDSKQQRYSIKYTSIHNNIKKSNLFKDYYRSYYNYQSQTQKYNTQKISQANQKQFTNYNYNLIDQNSLPSPKLKITSSCQIVESQTPFQINEQMEKKMHEIIKKLLFDQNNILIKANFKQIEVILDQTSKMLQNTNNLSTLKFPIYQTYNNLSTFEGKNKGKIQLIEINSKFILLILLENENNIYYSVVDDNPFMNNINLFADFPAKEHPINLYTDLFMRMYMRFLGNNLTILQLKQIKEIYLL